MKKVIKLKESELINVIKKILKEQVGIGTMTRVGSISKSAPKTGGRMKGPDTGGGDVDPCHFENIKNVINTCIKSKNSYTSTKNSDYYAYNLYKAMKGMTLSQDKTYKAFEDIPDRDNFCRTVANFSFDGEELIEWLRDEQLLNYSKIWDIVKKKVGNDFAPDECEFQKFMQDPSSYYLNKKIQT